jgi:hypothetical protein
MPEETVESLATAIAPAKQDWKAVATLLLSALIFVSGVTWVVSGQILKAANKELQDNTQKVIAIESKQALYDQKVIAADKRLDDVLTEMKSLNQKVGTVAESQARMEGFILGKK